MGSNSVIDVGQWMEESCEGLRDRIRDLSYEVKELKENGYFRFDETFPGQHGEMMANIMISYRHLEDARMRVGKVMQQLQGGVSIFDRESKDGP